MRPWGRSWRPLPPLSHVAAHARDCDVASVSSFLDRAVELPPEVAVGARLQLLLVPSHLPVDECGLAVRPVGDGASRG
eukprot:2378842-Pyramimonas_sp.AAC.1